MYYVYIIKNEKNERYIGYTRKLDERIKSHNTGLNKSTKGHYWEIVYYEAYKCESDARKREKSLKRSGKGRQLLYERIKSSLEA